MVIDLRSDNGLVLRTNSEWFRYSLVDFLAIGYFAHKLLPSFGYFMPSVIYLGLFAVLTVIILFTYGIHKPQRVILPTIALAIVQAMDCLQYFLEGQVGAIALYGYGELQVFLFIWVALCYVYFENRLNAKKFFGILMFFYVVTGITTVLGCIQYPEASRVLALGSASSHYNAYVRRNIGGFTFIYEMVLLTPLFIVMLKKRMVGRFLGIFLVALPGIVAIYSQYTTALLIYLFTVVVLLFVKITPRKIAVIGGIGIFTILFLSGFLSDMVESLAKSVSSDLVAERLEYMAGMLSGNNSADSLSAENRVKLYMKPLTAFADSMGMGAWNKKCIGGHSFVLDRMGYFGIFGIAGILVFLRGIYKLALQPFKKYDFFGYMLWGFLMAVLMMVLNPKTNVFYLCAILPLFGAVARRREDASHEVPVDRE